MFYELAMPKVFGEIIEKNPGLEAKVVEMIAEGDKVAARLIHSRDGKPFSEGVAIYRLSNGKIVDDWYVSKQIEE